MTQETLKPAEINQDALRAAERHAASALQHLRLSPATTNRIALDIVTAFVAAIPQGAGEPVVALAIRATPTRASGPYPGPDGSYTLILAPPAPDADAARREAVLVEREACAQTEPAREISHSALQHPMYVEGWNAALQYYREAIRARQP